MIVRTLEAFLSPKGAHLTFFAQSGLQLPKPDPVSPHNCFNDRTHVASGILSPKGTLLTFFSQSGLQLPKPDPVRPPIRLTDEDIGEVDRDRVKMILKNRYTSHTVLFIKVLLEGPCLWYSTTILRTTSQR